MTAHYIPYAEAGQHRANDKCDCKPEFQLIRDEDTGSYSWRYRHRMMTGRKRRKETTDDAAARH
jgi:hypothetical protein